MRQLGYLPGIITIALMTTGTAPAVAQDGSPAIRGLTEPYRTIDVAATESGAIASLGVREGDVVQQGQELAALNCQALTALLAIAKHGMESKGKLHAAEAEVRLREERAENFASVFASGHARPEEVRRAETDLAVARAHLLAAQEELVQRQLEFEKIEAQIEQRTVRAPLGGVVSRVHKDEGEFVAANDPTVLTIVQLDPLIAIFTLSTSQAGRLQTGQEVMVRLPEANKPVAAEVEFIDPVTDPESGTVLIKVRVPNERGTYRSGARCSLLLPAVNQDNGRGDPTRSVAAQRGR